jgi:hypothetical protein
MYLSQTMPVCRDAIIRWVTKKVGPAASTVSTAEELKAIETKTDLLVFGYFKEFSDSDAAFNAFTVACQELELECAQTTVEAVAKEAGAKLGSVSIIQNFKVHVRFVAVCCSG